MVPTIPHVSLPYIPRPEYAYLIPASVSISASHATLSILLLRICTRVLRVHEVSVLVGHRANLRAIEPDYSRVRSLGQRPRVTVTRFVRRESYRLTGPLSDVRNECHPVTGKSAHLLRVCVQMAHCFPPT